MALDHGTSNQFIPRQQVQKHAIPLVTLHLQCPENKTLLIRLWLPTENARFGPACPLSTMQNQLACRPHTREIRKAFPNRAFQAGDIAAGTLRHRHPDLSRPVLDAHKKRSPFKLVHARNHRSSACAEYIFEFKMSNLHLHQKPHPWGGVFSRIPTLFPYWGDGADRRIKYAEVTHNNLYYRG